MQKETARRGPALTPNGGNIKTLLTLAPSPQEIEIDTIMNQIHAILWLLYHRSLMYLATEFMREPSCYRQLGALSNLLNEEPERSGTAVGRRT